MTMTISNEVLWWMGVVLIFLAGVAVGLVAREWDGWDEEEEMFP